MLTLIASAALAASLPADKVKSHRAPVEASVTAKAKASVRILTAVRVPMSGVRPRHPRQRNTMLQLADGKHPAIIAEFE